jgi:hypothetical protein
MSQSTWTHYLYIIHFVDGHYYTGVSKRKGDNPSCDGYWGSALDKSKWHKVMYYKEIIAYLWCDCHSQAYVIEEEWQKRNFSIKHPLCLNKHFGSTNFCTESSMLGGRTGGSSNVQNNTGFWRKDLLEKRLETCRQGGLKGGKAAVESGQLAEAQKKAWQATSRPIVLISLSTGEKITHPSLQAAARAIGGSAGAICNVLKGHRNSHKGFSAEYL